jgi:phosphohistidine phosphatase SixA
VAIAAASSPDSLLSADSLLVELRKGGYTMLWRHTATDHSVREPRDYESTPRFQQRNLTDRGIADAKAVGTIFTAAAIPVGEVLASPMFRTRETAEYAFGRVESTPILRQLDPSPEQRRLIGAPPAPGTNRVLVTHHFVIERNVPGIRPGDVAEGEAVVVRPLGDGSVRAVGIFKMADWERLGMRAPLVTPPTFETPEHAAVAEYLRTFNTGDAARMRRFLEHRVVPNPARGIEERLAAFERLKTTLGAVSIVSVDTPEAGRVVVRLRGGPSGTQATATFGIETQAPYRITSITYHVSGH